MNPEIPENPIVEEVLTEVPTSEEATVETKPKKAKKPIEPCNCSNLKKAVERLLESYREKHNAKTAEDYKYPGLRELYEAYHS